MMSARRRARAGAMVLTVSVFALLWQACGGGGGSSSGTAPGSGPTNTRAPGSPPVTQPGQRGTPTPTPGAVPTPAPEMVFVASGESIADAARNAPDGAVVVVAPGTYSAVLLDPGDLQGTLTFLADVTGQLTNGPAAPVTIVAGSSDEAAFEAFSQTGLIIDGFTLRGGTDAAFLFGDSSSITVRNCTVTSSGGDAVHFERSDDVLVFNNVLTGNKGAGVAVFGTTNLRVINNTIYNNATDGILLTLDENSNASTGAFVVNNILQKNPPSGIVVDSGPPSSLDGFDADFNLNTNGYDGTDAGANDIAADPLFIFPGGGDFHLAPSSRALDHGTDAIDGDLVDALEQRSTQTDSSLDTFPLDLGYHYLAPIPTPTNAPRPTKTSTGTATKTGGVPGATPTPTRTAGGATSTPTTTPAGKPTRTTKPTRTPKG
jgi:parallel beta-helix repeat protein